MSQEDLQLSPLQIMTLHSQAEAASPRMMAAALEEGDHVGVTFALAGGIMMISTAFFFYQATRVQGKWQASMFTIGCVTGTAFWHYQFLTEHWSKNGKCPPMYRYIDWFLTVPLQILEFWMILRATVQAGWDMFARLLVLSLLMLIAGYAGETQLLNQWAGFMVGLIAWFLIIFEVFAGNAAKDAKLAPVSAQKAFNSLRLIVAVGWSLYPIGYVVGNAGGGDDRIENTLNGIYNVADLVNKTAFGLAIYSAAVACPVEEKQMAKKLADIEAVHQQLADKGKKKQQTSSLVGGGRGNVDNNTNTVTHDTEHERNEQQREQQQLSPRTMRDNNGPQHPRGMNAQQFGGFSPASVPHLHSTTSVAEPEYEHNNGGPQFVAQHQDMRISRGHSQDSIKLVEPTSVETDNTKNNGTSSSGGGGILGALFGGGPTANKAEQPQANSPQHGGQQGQQQYSHPSQQNMGHMQVQGQQNMGGQYNNNYPMQQHNNYPQQQQQHFHHQENGFHHQANNFSPMARSTSMH